MINKEKIKGYSEKNSNQMQDQGNQTKMEEKLEDKSELGKRGDKNQKKYILRPNNKGNGNLNGIGNGNEDSGATTSKRPASRSVHHIENEVSRGNNNSNSNGNPSQGSKRILRSDLGRKK